MRFCSLGYAPKGQNSLLYYMKRNIYYNLICLLFLTVLVFVSCEDESTPIFASFKNKQELCGYHISGDILKIEFFAQTRTGNLKEIRLSTYDTQNGTKLCLDTLLSVKKAEFKVDYQIPYFYNDSVHMELQLEVFNEAGDKSYHTLSMYVCNGGYASLREHTGLLFYGGKSSRANVIDLCNPSQKFNLALLDTSLVHVDIYAYSGEDNNTDLLSGEWRTRTDVDFVRFNDFDYADATPLSLENLYNASRRSNAISNIRQGDIIIVGKSNKVWGVFLVTLCYDQEGVENDGYLLNYKSLYL